MDAGGGMLEINVGAGGAAHLQLATLTAKCHRSDAISAHCRQRTGLRRVTSTLLPMASTSPNGRIGREHVVDQSRPGNVAIEHQPRRKSLCTVYVPHCPCQSRCFPGCPGDAGALPNPRLTLISRVDIVRPINRDA